MKGGQVHHYFCRIRAGVLLWLPNQETRRAESGTYMGEGVLREGAIEKQVTNRGILFIGSKYITFDLQAKTRERDGE